MFCHGIVKNHLYNLLLSFQSSSKAREGVKSNKKHPSLLHCTVLGLSKAAIQEVLYKKAVLKKFTTPTGNTYVGVLFKNVAGRKTCNFIKKRPQNRCFPGNISKFLVLLISKITCERLLFDFFNGSLLHRRKVSWSRLYDGVRRQCLTHKSSFLFLSLHEPSPSLPDLR